MKWYLKRVESKKAARRANRLAMFIAGVRARTVKPINNFLAELSMAFSMCEDCGENRYQGKSCKQVEAEGRLLKR